LLTECARQYCEITTVVRVASLTFARHISVIAQLSGARFPKAPDLPFVVGRGVFLRLPTCWPENSNRRSAGPTPHRRYALPSPSQADGRALGPGVWLARPSSGGAIRGCGRGPYSVRTVERSRASQYRVGPQWTRRRQTAPIRPMSDLSVAEKELAAFGAAQIAALHPTVPPLLYHYTTADGMAGIVQSGRMWAHNLGNMNDFTEVRFGASVLRAHLDRGYALEPDPRACDLFRTIRRQLGTIELSTVFALSFSADGDERGMWRLYADRGTGFSFGIPAFKLAQPWGGYLIRCNYSGDDLDAFCVRALAKIREVFLADVSAGRTGTYDAYAALFFSHVVWFGPIFKHKVWSDEQEWRVVYIRPSQHHKQRSDGRPYIEIPVPEDGRLPIGAVCAGPNCDQQGTVRPLRELMNKSGYGAVLIYNSNHAASHP